jgi:DNA-directed RNA polymerase specialized sigma24 family protein
VNDYFRKGKESVSSSLEEEGIDPPDECADPHRSVPETEEKLKILESELNKCPPQERDCYYCFEWMNLPDSTIARLLGLDVPTVRVYRSRVKKRVQKVLSQQVSCADCQKELAASRLKGLYDGRRQAFEKHMNRCDGCRSMQEEYQKVDISILAIVNNEYVLETQQNSINSKWKSFSQMHQDCFLRRVYTNRSNEDIAKELGIEVYTIIKYCSQVSIGLQKALKKATNNDGNGGEAR